MKRIVFLLIAALGLTLFSNAQKFELKYGAKRFEKRQDADMKKFRENRIGMFVHWGLFAIPAGEWNGKMYKGAVEFLPQSAKIDMKDWMKLMDQWNPDKFDAKEFVKMAQTLGAKYIKVTTKHHDGFCLWPSKYSKYTVAHTPSKRDLIGEIVDAAKEVNMDVHLYYSILDWSHPDWRYEIKTKEDSIAFARFLTFCENQLKELATRYPSVKDFWFDGTWDASFKANGKWSAHIEEMLKEMIPGVTINSRLRADDYGKRHFDSNGCLMGDYESGYERRLPDPVKDLKVTTWDWEGILTMPENLWGYHKDWSWSYVKTKYEVLDWVVHAVSMGGNLLINFGPKADGTFRTEEIEMAEAVGKWLKENGEAVYGCDYSGWAKQDWGYFTRKGETVYMVVFNQPFSGKLKVDVPSKTTIEKATLLNGTEVKVEETTRNQYNVSVPQQTMNQPYVIKLKVSNQKQSKNKYQKALT